MVPTLKYQGIPWGPHAAAWGLLPVSDVTGGPWGVQVPGHLLPTGGIHVALTSTWAGGSADGTESDRSPPLSEEGLPMEVFFFNNAID